MLSTSPTWPRSMISGSASSGASRRSSELAGADQVPVLAGQPHRRPAVAVDQVDDLLVDQAAQDHLHHVHGLGVGHPHPLDELAVLAQPFEQGADLGAAAVDDHRVDPHQLHQHHVAGEALLQGLVHHGVAAVLDHHGLAAEAADVGQRLDQDMGDGVGTFARQGHLVFRSVVGLAAVDAAVSVPGLEGQRQARVRPSPCRRRNRTWIISRAACVIALEAEGQLRLGVGGAHQPQAPVELGPQAVDADQLSTPSSRSARRITDCMMRSGSPSCSGRASSGVTSAARAGPRRSRGRGRGSSDSTSSRRAPA